LQTQPSMAPSSARHAPDLIPPNHDVHEAILALVRALGVEVPGRADAPGFGGTVATRWSALAHFERDGQRYVVARATDRGMRIAGLSRREEEVIARAALGHAQKVIAYDLGISASTVRVLLGRVRRKVGARTSQEAVRLWHAAMPANDPRGEPPTKDVDTEPSAT